MGQKQQNVTIKGTKDGLTLLLNDACSFHELMEELQAKLTSNDHQADSPLTSVHIRLGNRYISKDQENEIKAIVREKKSLVVDTIESNVITKEEAFKWKKTSEIMSVSKVVRSGQVLEAPGDVLLIGDVNPGGTIVAGGNIFILGALRGIAHAGFDGNLEAIIAASVMKPSQLRIGKYISRSPDKYSNDDHEMECAFVDEEKQQIILDRIQALTHIRPNLTRLERGM